MELTKEETKEKTGPEKVKLDIDVYQKEFADLVIDCEQSLRDGALLQRQVKALKSLAKSSTEKEWAEKKKIYEESRIDTEKKKKEYYEIRDKRNALLNACSDIFTGIKTKIETYEKECIRLAEALRARIIAEGKAKKEEEERKLREKEEMEAAVKEGNEAYCETCEGSGLVSENKDSDIGIPCPDCSQDESPQQNQSTDNATGPVVDTTATPATHGKQKPRDGQTEPVTEEIDLDFEVYDITKFLSAIIRGERGATTDLVLCHGDEIMILAEKLNCKPGDEIIPGCRAVAFDYGDMIA